MPKYYTGVGSRETPTDICELMTTIAKDLDEQGFILRSGGADGADESFANGVTYQNAEIYLPWPGFNELWDANYFLPTNLKRGMWLQAEEIAQEIHPAWDKLSDGARKLHTRNVFQVLGQDLDTPSRFLICWAQTEHRTNEVRGGTRTAVEVAKLYGVPVINLYM